MFKNIFHSTGDYSINGPADYMSGTGVSENIKLHVTGTLRVNNPNGLSMRSVGENYASLTARKLITPRLSLTGGEVRGNIGLLDMSQNSTDLYLVRTNARHMNVLSAVLANGHYFALHNALGDIGLHKLTVSKRGSLYVADGSKRSIITLDARDAALTFLLPANVAAGQTVVSVNTAQLDNGTIGAARGSERLSIQPGESLTLLAASTSLSARNVNKTVTTQAGDVFDLTVNPKDITLTLQQLAPASPDYPRLKAYAEGITASVAFLAQGQDLVTDLGIGSAQGSTRDTSGGVSGEGTVMGAFSAMNSGVWRVNSGSHVDVEGVSMLAGLAVGKNLGRGRLTLGAFFEGGWGSYDSHNSFSNYASVDGDGNTSYYGGGILGRYSVTSDALSGLYVDASARMGRVKTDFNSDDLQYSSGEADFDSASLYYGLHGGLGYVWNINEAAKLDLSAKLLWTRQDGDSVSVRGDQVRFKDTESLRTRLGGRFSYAVHERFAPYIGAYWEHEFDGKVHSTVNGRKIDAPSLEGDTGIGELGLSVRPFTQGAAGGLSFDLGVQGHTGQREGVSGNFQLRFEF